MLYNITLSNCSNCSHFQSVKALQKIKLTTADFSNKRGPPRPGSPGQGELQGNACYPNLYRSITNQFNNSAAMERTKTPNGNDAYTYEPTAKTMAMTTTT